MADPEIPYNDLLVYLMYLVGSLMMLFLLIGFLIPMCTGEASAGADSRCEMNAGIYMFIPALLAFIVYSAYKIYDLFLGKPAGESPHP